MTTAAAGGGMDEMRALVTGWETKFVAENGGQRPTKADIPDSLKRRLQQVTCAHSLTHTQHTARNPTQAAAPFQLHGAKRLVPPAAAAGGAATGQKPVKKKRKKLPPSVRGINQQLPTQVSVAIPLKQLLHLLHGLLCAAGCQPAAYPGGTTGDSGRTVGNRRAGVRRRRGLGRARAEGHPARPVPARLLPASKAARRAQAAGGQAASGCRQRAAASGRPGRRRPAEARRGDRECCAAVQPTGMAAAGGGEDGLRVLCSCLLNLSPVLLSSSPPLSCLLICPLFSHSLSSSLLLVVLLGSLLGSLLSSLAISPSPSLCSSLSSSPILDSSSLLFSPDNSCAHHVRHLQSNEDEAMWAAAGEAELQAHEQEEQAAREAMQPEPLRHNPAPTPAAAADEGGAGASAPLAAAAAAVPVLPAAGKRKRARRTVVQATDAASVGTSALQKASTDGGMPPPLPPAAADAIKKAGGAKKTGSNGGGGGGGEDLAAARSAPKARPKKRPTTAGGGRGGGRVQAPTISYAPHAWLCPCVCSPCSGSCARPRHHFSVWSLFVCPLVVPRSAFSNPCSPFR